MSGPIARKWVVGGRVQGVGFRPFVYRLACRYGLGGWVRNHAGEVEVFVQGDAQSLGLFATALIAEAPPLARPKILAELPTKPGVDESFEIHASQAGSSRHIHLSPDYFACDECLRELEDPHDRRYRYPFINCTQCGPRYTLIESLPYDRARTSMAGFALCPNCAAEYQDPLDRRFHAEPIACPACGPQLEFRAPDQSACRGEAALTATIAALRAGGIVAVKGIGGYHLLCDAMHSRAVQALRRRKKRPDKPFAVMFPIETGLVSLRRAVRLDPDHERLLRDPIRPIVLIAKHDDATLAAEIAPGCAEIGAMLPYSPLHHLLLRDFGTPLVATSANISGEPVLTDPAMVESRLGGMADALLHHDRPILRPADDPVYRIIAGSPRPMRLGRGNAPLEISLPFTLARPVLALGGQWKNTITLGWGERAVVSPHLGDMDAPRSRALLQEVARDLQRLYGVEAALLACDAHPNYATTRLTDQSKLPVVRVLHHHAHAAALTAEYPRGGDWLIFTWDGAGYGEDGTIWGGEALLGQPGRWRRVASWRPFALLGGDRAAREPWRNALALCWESGSASRFQMRDSALFLRPAFEQGVNCPQTSSVGRLFDAAAAFLGLCEEASYEGQAAIQVEAAARGRGDAIPLPLARHSGLWRTDWQSLLSLLQDERRSVADRASMFHASLARALVDQALAIRAEHEVSHIGLTGGVFQNRILSEEIKEMAEAAGFSIFIPERLPCNDAGLSFGQLIEAGQR